MAKGQKRSNRELKKPKKEAPKASASAASPFAVNNPKPGKGKPKSS